MNLMTLMNVFAWNVLMDGEEGGWHISKFFENSQSTVKSVGGMFIILLGIVMIVVAGYNIGKALIMHGKTQTNWFITILLLLVGGAFAVGGYDLLAGIAQGMGSDVKDMGEEGGGINFIIPQLYRLFR